ncbi:MAG: hypothetical protein KC466_19875, partial [Myxococcales bacterium]|nr:hypothetical protein [Myxococcales bacterium]
MHFEIRHTTRFDYGDEVRLDPLTVRLRPRTDVTQRLVRWVLACEPKPVGIAEIVDLDGNDLYVLRFEGRHRSLELVTWSEVETYRTNPFDYVATDMSTLTLPVRYSGPEARSLDVYRASLEPSDEVAELADRIAREVDGLTLQFLPRLTRWIHDNLTAVVRPHGEPWRPSRTLYEG